MKVEAWLDVDMDMHIGDDWVEEQPVARSTGNVVVEIVDAAGSICLLTSQEVDGNLFLVSFESILLSDIFLSADLILLLLGLQRVTSWLDFF